MRWMKLNDNYLCHYGVKGQKWGVVNEKKEPGMYEKAFTTFGSQIPGLIGTFNPGYGTLAEYAAKPITNASASVGRYMDNNDEIKYKLQRYSDKLKSEKYYDEIKARVPNMTKIINVKESKDGFISYIVEVKDGNGNKNVVSGTYRRPAKPQVEQPKKTKSDEALEKAGTWALAKSVDVYNKINKRGV